MSILLRSLLHPYMAPVGDADGGGGGAAVDRGDSFTPTDDEPASNAGGTAADTLAAAEKAAEDKAAAEEAAKKAAADAASGDDPENPDADPDKPKDGKKDTRIPLSRHKEILDRERAQRAELEAKLANFQKGKEVAVFNEDITALENEVTGLETEYTQLLADGKIKEAASAMAKIRAAERQITEAKSEMRSQAAIAVATEQVRYETALERIESAYPVLNQDHDDFDNAKMLEVVEMKTFFETMRNQTPTKALQSAVEKVMGKPATAAQTKAISVAPKVDADEAEAAAKAAAKAAERKKDAVTKTLDATGKTPADVSKVGIDSDKVGGALSAKDVMKMTQDDFRKLPDDVLARMRGDEFAG